MIDIVRWFLARHPAPDDSMAPIFASIETHLQIVVSKGTSDRPSPPSPVDASHVKILKMGFRPDSPAQHACLRVVIEALAKIGLWWETIKSHRFSFSGTAVRDEADSPKFASLRLSYRGIS